MKRFILFSLVLFCLLGTYNKGIAQDKITTINCGKRSSETMSDEVCYPKEDYSLEAAKDSFKVYMLSGYACSVEECPRPSRSYCEPRIISIPEVEEDDKSWCFDGKVKWKCTPCGPKPANPTERPDVEGAETLEDHAGHARHYDHEILSSSDMTSAVIGTIKKIYPNPSLGEVNIRLKLEKEEAGELQLTLTNLQGKQLLTKSYKKVPTSIFHAKLDASTLPAGIYFLNARVDGTVIGTSRLVIQ